MTTRIVLAALALSGAGTQAEPTAAPAGATQFCLRNPSFCEPHTPVSAPMSAMSVIQQVNREVNSQILPQTFSTDAEKRAENSNWRVVMPAGLGGCVEFVQTKRLLLAWAGIPMGAMRFAQVRSPTLSDQFHAVLLVRIGRVEVVLDNLSPAIWPVDLAKYQFVSIQDGWNWNSN